MHEQLRIKNECFDHINCLCYRAAGCWRITFSGTGRRARYFACSCITNANYMPHPRQGSPTRRLQLRLRKLEWRWRRRRRRLPKLHLAAYDDDSQHPNARERAWDIGRVLFNISSNKPRNAAAKNLRRVAWWQWDNPLPKYMSRTRAKK